jgi:hypothetical protein
MERTGDLHRVGRHCRHRLLLVDRPTSVLIRKPRSTSEPMTRRTISSVHIDAHRETGSNLRTLFGHLIGLDSAPDRSSLPVDPKIKRRVLSARCIICGHDRS